MACKEGKSVTDRSVWSAGWPLSWPWSVRRYNSQEGERAQLCLAPAGPASISMGNAPESLRRHSAEFSWQRHLLQQTCFPRASPMGHCHCLSCCPWPFLHLGASSSFSREVCPSPSSLTNTLPPRGSETERWKKEREVWREGSAARIMSAQSLLLYCIYSNYFSLQNEAIPIIKIWELGWGLWFVRVFFKTSSGEAIIIKIEYIL